MIPGFEQTENQLDALTGRGDLISRQAAIDELIAELKEKPETYIDNGLNQYDIESVLTALPSAQPERKTGKWIKHKDRSCWYCSECNADDYYAYNWDCDTGEYEFQDNYCPNCGAKMEVEG